MEERGYTLGNLDCTIIAQKPKLSPHKVRAASRARCCFTKLRVHWRRLAATCMRRRS